MVERHQLSLVALDEQQFARILQDVPGGAENLLDIYPLSPLQEGMLFHRLLDETSDSYVLSTLFALRSHADATELANAVQKLIDRYDVLRTAVLWERLPQPLQVVHRNASLQVEEILVTGDPLQALREQMRSQRRPFDIAKAPLVRLVIATCDERCHALLQVHHIVCDHRSLRTLVDQALLVVAGVELHGAPVPYRDYVAEALGGAGRHDDEAFFREKLGDVDEPTAPFGIVDGSDGFIQETSHTLDSVLASEIRVQARRAGVSPARLFHAAWALVTARTSGRDDVVFGTVVLAASRRSADAGRQLGMFVNTLPLRVRVGELSAIELLQQVDGELSELLRHEHASLAMAQRCSGISGSGALFTTLLNYRHGGATPAHHDCTPPPGISVLARGEAWSAYPVAVIVDDLGDGFILTGQTDPRIDPARVVRYLETALQSLVTALHAAPAQRASALSILPTAERQDVLERFNATEASFPSEVPTHEVFEEQVRRAPHALAVTWGTEVLTYSELNARANQLARYLRRSGVAPGDFVPVLMARSLPMLVGQLAVLKCGAVYVPVDPELPAQRRTFMLNDCGARLILSDGPAPDDLPSNVRQRVNYREVDDLVRCEAVDDLHLAVAAAAPAYVMYTSGSTGTPKGVVVTHRAVNRLAVNGGYAQIGPDDCIAHHSNATFDASTFEIWTSLLNGARVLIVAQSVVLEPQRFAQLLAEQRVTALYMSAGLFNQYTRALADVFPRLRYLMVGGEALEPSFVRRVLHQSPPQQLLNVYGPTECTTFATRYVIHSVASGAASIPIGSPISNTQIYITDADLRPVPIGVTGAIFIGGAGVADGYLNRPQLTAERFRSDPFRPVPGARIYCTGDLGRWNADGTIEYLGRNDDQVKVRGFRIEPGEIETQLLRDSRLQDVVVVAREDVSGDKRLVAYLVPVDLGDVPGVEELRAGLRSSLPEYMVPSAFVALEHLPLTKTGKIDRRALPAPDLSAYVAAAFEPPTGETQERLAQIWRQLLNLPQVGRNHHFFEIGGNSLTVMRLIVLVADAFLIPFSAQAVFRNPTLADMAAAIDTLQRTHVRDATGTDDVALEIGVV